VKRANPPAFAILGLCIMAALASAQAVKRDYWPTREWKTDRPENHGLAPAPLLELERAIEKELIYSALLIKDGFIVFEYYKGNLDRNSKFVLFSCTKSVTSALIGIAIDKGLIKGVDQKISDFFPSLTKPDVDERKKRITLRHLLTMTSGLALADRPYYLAMTTSNDWVEYALTRPMKDDPGNQFTYSTGVSHLLSAIVQKVSGTDTLRFASKNLFAPIYSAPEGYTRKTTLTNRDFS